MSYGESVYNLSGPRMSEYIQLRAEHKWILETLNKLKKQRNCLQIERLHLESMKAKWDPTSTKPTSTQTSVTPGVSNIVDDPSSKSIVDLMQNATKNVERKDVFEETILDDANVNEEELDLLVHKNSMFDMNINQDLDIEEDDEGESEDDMFIDMNLLMYGKPKEL